MSCNSINNRANCDKVQNNVHVFMQVLKAYVWAVQRAPNGIGTIIIILSARLQANPRPLSDNTRRCRNKIRDEFMYHFKDKFKHKFTLYVFNDMLVLFIKGIV